MESESVMQAGFGTSIMLLKQSTGGAHNSHSIATDDNDELAFKFRTNAFVVTMNKLNDPESLKNIDLTYYQAKCREVLKRIYDQSFKFHSTYHELKSDLLKMELQQNLKK